MAFCVSSRYIYLSALSWISSMVFVGRLDNESLKALGRSPFNRLSTAGWVSSASSVSALNCSRKSQSGSPCH